MKDNRVSKEWESIFSRELGGVNVSITEGGNRCFTELQQSDGCDNAFIHLSDALAKEIHKLAALRHEHGHIELDSYGLKDPELMKFGHAMMNVVEDVRINVTEAERFVGFREGMKQILDMTSTPVAQLLGHATQNEPGNKDEEYIFELAHRVNGLYGAQRGEARKTEFYDEYSKLVRAVARYIGKLPPEQETGGSGKEGKGLRGKENDGLTPAERAAAEKAANAALSETEQFFAQHKDIGQTGSGQGWGALMHNNRKLPPVNPAILAMVSERFKKLRVTGKKNDESGIRPNMRIAIRARFTGEQKIFRHPSHTDIKHAKFVILQDVSGSMGVSDMQIGSSTMQRCDMAYHFGRAMEEFLKKNGARVQCYRFNDGPFMVGLSMEADGGTGWSTRNVEQLLRWIQDGHQVILITDGGIGFHDEAKTRRVFAHANRRPVGMKLETGESALEAVFPEWKRFAVQGDPRKAVDEIVRQLARRFRW